MIDNDNILELVRAALPNVELPDETETADGVRALTAEIARLTPLAEDGRQYRADLVGEALAEGVRAMGAEFPQETYRTVLEGATIPVIQRMRDDWRRMGDERLKGGRQTEDTAVGAKERAEKPRQLVPDSAHKV